MSKLAEILQKHQAEIASEWMKEMPATTRRKDLMSDSDLKQETSELLQAVSAASKDGGLADITTTHWAPVRELLTSISSSRAKQGFTPTETAGFVFSLKRPLTNRLRKELGKDTDILFSELAASNQLIDSLGLYSTEAFVKTREQFIARQQEEMLELSTPVVKLWDGILALPLIGTLDSARTQVVMESLLRTIVETNSKIAIIDITGVPTVDTLVAQHLLKTITAARLMGAECIISGIRPQIAQTIVHLGINLTDIITKSKMSDAFALALQRTGKAVVRVSKLQSAAEPGKDK
ncbi:MAG TPA: STAS domain-containing protein [Terriglobales bacterium]|nr:STAS domain-containing protein [Terriglobales bacterium]